MNVPNFQVWWDFHPEAVGYCAGSSQAGSDRGIGKNSTASR